MNFPLNLHLFGYEINSHLIFEILAFAIGYRFYIHLKSKINDPYSREERLILLIAAAFGALIFSRLIGALENVQEWQGAPNFWLYLYSTKTIVGGFIGGWLLVEIAKLFLKKTASSGDILVFPIIIALIIGRLGCFSQGIHEMTYGNPTTFLTGMDLGDGILRHPLALYEIIFLILVALVLHLHQKNKKLPDGFQFKLFMFLYFLYRFFADWMKPHFPLFFGLTSIQIAILITYLFNLKSIIRLLRLRKNQSFETK